MKQSILALGAVAFILVSLFQLEATRRGLEMTPVQSGHTPATLYKRPNGDGPLVVIAHGFAGSRGLMEAFSLTLARSGYQVLAFDFEGHGRNPAPMGGDVTSIDGTTALLIRETQRVIDTGLEISGWGGPVALIGHSMASDIVIRVAKADSRVGPVVAVSMFSGAITPKFPRDLLVVSGQWEASLRTEGLNAARLVDPKAQEGQSVQRNGVTRRTVIAPWAEHISVLYNATSLKETRDWLDGVYGRNTAQAPLARTGAWIIGLLAGIVALGRSLAFALPQHAIPPEVPTRAFWLASLTVLLVPLVATNITLSVLPVLVADYLAIHLFLYGSVQLLILQRAGVRFGNFHPVPFIALLAFALGTFGWSLDQYVSSFAPFGLRLWVFVGVALGAIPFMLADTLMSGAGRGPLWRRLVTRLGFLCSLAIAVGLDFERLMFLLIILPVIVLFFAVFGLMGRWVAQRAGALPVGIALGIILAWSLASTFPLFDV